MILAHIKSIFRDGSGMTTAKYVLAPPMSPGEVLRKRILKEDISQETLAKALDVSRFSVNQIINEKRAITPEMALRLARVTGTSPEFWLNLQREVDLYVARKRLGTKLEKLPVLRTEKNEQQLYRDL
jgi:addiction module HigA family antidote